MPRKYLQGFYKPRFPSKYKGDPTKIVYRSSWELSAMRRFDETPAFIQWGSEEIVVHYRSPIDDKIHRYFPDFLVKKQDPKTLEITTYLVEIKPKAQTKPPPIQHRVTKNYLYEVKQWGVNQAKWNAAITFCKDRGWKFLILSEEDLGL